MIPVVVADLDALAAEADRQTREVAGLVGGLSGEALRWRPSSKRWSVGGHVAHLGLVKPFFKLLRVSLGAGFEITLAHNRRHIWLAREIVADPTFLGGGAAARG